MCFVLAISGARFRQGTSQGMWTSRALTSLVMYMTRALHGPLFLLAFDVTQQLQISTSASCACVPIRYYWNLTIYVRSTYLLPQNSI